MSNTFTPILPNLTASFRRVLQERASLASMVMTDFRAEQAAVNQSVTVPFAPTVAGADRIPAAGITVAADRAVTSTPITITKDRKFPFHMTGDDYLRMQQNPEFMPLSMAQAMRAWRNEVHSDIAALHTKAAGYYSTSTPSSGASLGTAATTPFASDISLITGAEKLLNDSLAPGEDRFLFIDTAAKATLGGLGQLIKANEAGTSELLRQGIIGQLAGFNVVWGNDVKLHTAGTGASYQLNGSHVAGATTITVDTGSGTILAGDVVTINSVQYVVATALSAGSFTITSGLLTALADNVAVAVSATSRRNMAFHREAIGLAIRLPALPPRGDIGEHTEIADPETGIGCRMSYYKGYGLDQYELSSAWGVAAVRPELLKIILG